MQSVRRRPRRPAPPACLSRACLSAAAAERSLAALGGQRRRLSPHDCYQLHFFEPPLLFSQEQVCGYECGENYGDYAVHGEECGVEFAEVAGRHEGVFVGQEQRHSYDPGDGEFSQCEGGKQGDQEQKHNYVEGAGDPEGAGDADVAGDGMESGVAVEVEILTGVEDVETCDPEGDGGGENKDARIEGATNGDPCGCGRDSEGEAEREVRPAGEALGIGIKEQDGERHGREPEGEAIQLGSGQNEDGAGDDDEGSDEGGREMAGGESASAGTGIGGVESGIGEAVEGHGGGAGSEHGDYDPEKLMSRGQAGGGQHSSAEGERESEDGVLPLDHFEGDAEVVEDGHGSRVSVLSSQFSVLSSQLSVLGSRFSEMQKAAQVGVNARRRLGRLN